MTIQDLMTNLRNNGGLPPFSKFIENIAVKPETPVTLPENNSNFLATVHTKTTLSPYRFSHTHSTSLPTNLEGRNYLRDTGSSCVSTFIPGYQNYNPTYRRGYEDSFTFNSNYQFPSQGPVQTSNITHAKTGATPHQHTYRNWNPEVALETFSKLNSSFNEIIEIIDALQASYKDIFNNSNANPPSIENRIAFGNLTYVNIDSLRDLILSLPKSVDKLITYFSQNLEFLRLLRHIQSTISQSTIPREVPTRINFNPNSNVENPQRNVTLQPLNTSSDTDTSVQRHKRNRFISMEDLNISHKKPKVQSKRGSLQMEPISSVRGDPGAGQITSGSTLKKSPKQASFIKFDSQKGRKFNIPSACNHCGSEKTPEWRRGPNGDKTLCNACGIFYAKLIKKYHSPEEAAKLMLERKKEGLQLDRHV